MIVQCERKISLKMCTATLLFFGFLAPGVLCQFNLPLPEDVTATVAEDVTLTWDIMHFSHISNILWSVTLDSSPSTSFDILVWFTASGKSIVQNNYNVENTTDGSLTLKNVALNNTGVYKIFVTYKATSPGNATDEDTVNVTVQGQPTTATTTITTTTMSSTTTTTPNTTTTTMPSTTTTTPTTTTAETTTTPTEAITTTTPSITAETTDSTENSSITPGISNESTVIIVVASSIGGVVLVGLVVFLGLFLYRARRHGHGKHKHNHERNTRRQQSGSAYIHSGPNNFQNMEMYPSRAFYMDTRHSYPPSSKGYPDRCLGVTNQQQPTQRHEGIQMRSTHNVKSRYSVYPGNLVHSGNSQNFSPNHYPRYEERQRPATTGYIHQGHVNHAHQSGYTLYHPQDYYDNWNMY